MTRVILITLLSISILFGTEIMEVPLIAGMNPKVSMLKKQAKMKKSFVLHFDGKEKTFKVKKLTHRSAKDYTVFAGLKGDKNRAVLTVQGERIVGTITLDEKRFSLKTDKSGKIQITKENPEQLVPFGNDTLIPPTQKSTPTQNSSTSISKEQTSIVSSRSEAITIIDLMILYTQDFAGTMVSTH